jgi:hypothetical protein
VKLLSYDIRYAGFRSSVTAAHFHGPAAAGKNAAPVFPIPTTSPSPLNGTVGPLNAQQEMELLNGLWYINIHTKNLPNGEIRAQVLFGQPKQPQQQQKCCRGLCAPATPMYYTEFAPVYAGMSFNWEPPMQGCNASTVVIHNKLAQTAVLQWYADSRVIHLHPGMNRLELPHYQQYERARVAFNACTGRCRLRWCPWTMLQMGGCYTLFEECGEVQIGHSAQNW